MKIYKSKKELIQNQISNNDIVLDVGFWGLDIKAGNFDWVHNILKSQARGVFGVDLYFDKTKLEKPENYKKQSAENFDFDEKFDVIFAGDLIEHLSNIGLFLDSCKRNLKDNGRLIITTPNIFILFNFVEKVFKKEPSVNSDHTMYFNFVVLRKLLEKNGWKVSEEIYLDDVWPKYKQSLKRRFLYGIYKFLGLFTDKFIENIVIIAKKDESR
ncbi:MAG: class I SAM-dependent methyltransferase [Candidatus Pacebacteria bacterium]|nr:class I SAM-dependent methyltransferase [Candidatus Paceibacterota bacterium]